MYSYMAVHELSLILPADSSKMYLAHLQQIYLILLFGKDEQDNLSPEQTKLVASLVDAIRSEGK